jgi:endogenous inhibitor of DNA gyrase (YacG/DUF329 family)
MAERQIQRSEAKAKPAAPAERKTCAICGKLRDPHYDPFCSKRCADVDLHRWLSGAYVLPGAPATPDAPEGEED